MQQNGLKKAEKMVFSGLVEAMGIDMRMKWLRMLKFFVSLWVRNTYQVMTETFVIQSDVAKLPIVEDRLFHFCQACNVGNYYSTLQVATLEAVGNAIAHGNQNRPEKAVCVTFSTCRGGVCVEVEDEGSGFDFSCFGALPDEGQVGQGLFVIHSLADSVEFTKGGSHVRMEFAVAGISPSDALARVATLRAFAPARLHQPA